MENGTQRDIFYMIARVAYKKGKRLYEKPMWVVSVYDRPNDIMNLDKKTMGRISSELYGKNYKGNRMIMVREILDKKKVGRTSRSSWQK
jgi:hypothetical protein